MLQSAPREAQSPEGQRVTPVNPGETLETLPRSVETVVPIQDPYDIEVPIGDFGVLRVGLSRKELEARVEGLRKTLYVRTFAAAAVALLEETASLKVSVTLLLRQSATAETSVGATVSTTTVRMAP